MLKPIVQFLLPALAAGAVLTGVASGERTASAQEYAQEVVTVAPPAAPVEIIPVQPSPAHFWSPGYYGYAGGVGHVWHGGEWMRGRPGYSWNHAGWNRYGRGYVFHGGGWAHGGAWGHGGGWGHGGFRR